jgi:MFS family permease
MNQDNTRHNFRAFVWHACWLAFTVTFTEVNTVLPGMILKVGGSQIHVGILTAIMVGVPMLTQLLFAGFLTPKKRKKPFLLLGIFLRVGALSGMGWTLSRFTAIDPGWVIILIYGWMLIFTTSGAFAGVSYTDILGKSIAGDMRKRFLVVRQLLSSVGVLASALIARQILKHFLYPLNYEILFFAAASALFVASWGFIALKEKPVANRFESSSIFEVFKFIPGYLREDANLRSFIIINNLAGFATTLMPFYVVLARDTYSLKAEDIGNFLLIAIVGMILSNLLWSRIVRRHGFKGILTIWISLGAIIPVSALLLSSFASYAVFQFVFFLSGMAMSAQRISQEGVLLEISENDTRALYSGINGAFNLTIALFPLISGFLIAVVGYTPVFAMGSVAMISALFFARRLNCEVSETPA